MILVGTGHRPQSLPGGFANKKLHAAIKKEIIDCLTITKPELVYTGMALGFDQWLAESCLTLSIPYVAAIPFKDQPNRWPAKSRQHYQKLLNQALAIKYVDRIAGYISEDAPPDVYNTHKLLKRNQWMIDQMQSGDTLFSLKIPGLSGGTYQTVRYAYTFCTDLEGVLSINHYSLNPCDIWKIIKDT